MQCGVRVQDQLVRRDRLAVHGLFARWLPIWLMLGLLLSVPQHAWADPQRILLLHHPAWKTEEAALLEALRIYTRDLNGGVVSAAANTAAPQSVGNRALSSVAEQGQRASAVAVAWFFDDGGLRLYTLRVRTLDLQITPVVPRDDLDVAAQTLALKLRAFLTHDGEPKGASAAGDAPQTEHSDAANRTAAADIAPTAPAQVSPQSDIAIAPITAKTPRSFQLEGGFGYGVDVPLDLQWLRHLLVLRTALVLWKGSLAIELDGSVASRPSLDLAPYQVSIGDHPIGLALSMRLLRSRFVLSAGARASLHIIQASILGSGAPSGDIWRFSAGLGGVLQARLRLLRFLSLNLAVLAEGVVPRQRFTVAAVPAADLGAFRFATSLGLVFEIL